MCVLERVMFVYSFKISACLMVFLCQIPYIALLNLIIFRRELLKVLNQPGYLQQFLIK